MNFFFFFCVFSFSFIIIACFFCFFFLFFFESLRRDPFRMEFGGGRGIENPLRRRTPSSYTIDKPMIKNSFETTQPLVRNDSSRTVNRMRRGEEMVLEGGEALMDKGKNLLFKEGEMVWDALERGGEEVGEEVGEMVEKIVEGKVTGWGRSFSLAVTLYFLVAWTIVFTCLLFWSDASLQTIGFCWVMWPCVLGGGLICVYSYPVKIFPKPPSVFAIWHWGLFSSVFWLCILLSVHHPRLLFSFLWKSFCLLALLPPHILLYQLLSTFSSFLFAMFLSNLLSFGMAGLFGLILVSPNLWMVWMWPFLLWCFLVFMIGKIFF